VFIGVTLQKGIAGVESCGCFGQIHINPWITLLAIDIPLFSGLLAFRPIGQKLLPPPWPSLKHFFGISVPTFILLGALVPILTLNKPPEKTEKYEVVRPEEWTRKESTKKYSAKHKNAESLDEEMTNGKVHGEEWPLLKYIDIADSLRSGIVVVLLYHYDCPDCIQAIPLYDQMGRDLSDNEEAIRIAFIEVPPYGPSEESPIPGETLCLEGRLDPSKKWYFTTPLVVLIVDCSVVKSWEVEVPNLDEVQEHLANWLAGVEELRVSDRASFLASVGFVCPFNAWGGNLCPYVLPPCGREKSKIPSLMTALSCIFRGKNGAQKKNL
jgi:thiol-disulfide isomerase/thioredoxin